MDVRQQFSRQLYTTTARWRGYLDGQLKRLGLTRTRWTVLVELSRSDGSLSQRELATLIGTDAPTLVRMLDGLEKTGYVERMPDGSDRRTKRLRLTDRAKKITAEISVASAQVRERLLRDIDEADLQTCLRVLDKIGHELDQLA